MKIPTPRIILRALRTWVHTRTHDPALVARLTCCPPHTATRMAEPLRAWLARMRRAGMCLAAYTAHSAT